MVYVSIVGRNCAHWVEDCLSSVLASDYADYRVVFLDNGSDDGTPDLVSGRFPQVRLIRLTRNTGFGSGHNRVFGLALPEGADYAAILNVDTTVDPGWLSALVAASREDAGVAAWMPLQYDYSGRQLDPNFLKTASRNPDFLADHGRDALARTYRVPTCIGAAVLFPRWALERIGGFDPHYFAYCEESDWCQRAALAGLGVGVACRSRIQHWHTRLHPDQSYAVRPGVQEYHHLRSQFTLFLKNPARSFGRNLYGYLRSGLKTITARNGCLTDWPGTVRWACAQAWVLQHIGGLARRHRRDRQRTAGRSRAHREAPADRSRETRRLEIAILNSSLGIVNRGAEQVLLHLGRFLARDCNVTHLAGGRDLPAGCRRVPNLHRGHRLSRLFPRLPLAGRLRADPIDVERLTFAFAALPGLMARRPDCVVTPANFWASGMSALLRRLKRVPFVGRNGGWMMSGREGLRFRPDVYVVVNPEVAERLQEDHPDRDIRWIPNAVDLDRFSPGASSLQLSLPGPVFLCAAALEARKRVDLAIRAVAALERGSLVVVGHGPMATGIRALGLELLGPERFHADAAPSRAMPDYYRLCDVFTLPSLNEPFGMVYLEAMACNRPVVTQADRVRSEIVGHAGVLVDCADLAAYSAALARAATTHFGDAPRRRAEHFSWARTGPAYLDAIRSAISRQRRTGRGAWLP